MFRIRWFLVKNVLRYYLNHNVSSIVNQKDVLYNFIALNVIKNNIISLI